MRPADLREKSVEDLRELEKSLARDIFQNRLKNFTNRLDDTSAIRKTKRDLARIKTLLHERTLGLVHGRPGGLASDAGGAPKLTPSKPAVTEEAAKAAPKKKAATKGEAKAKTAETKPAKKAATAKKTTKKSEAK